MKALFELVNSGVQKFSFWEMERAGLKRNIARIKDYYRHNPTIVPSNHFLVRLLQTIAVPHALDTERYYDNVVMLSNRLSSALGMTSSIYKGHLFTNTFYNGSTEIILSITKGLTDVLEASEKWRNLSPVTVLNHPISTLELALPDGRQETTETGLAIIAIDIPLLALQYRAFAIDQAYTNEDGAQLTIMQFIRMYVIPNMLETHLDYVIFNRLQKLSGIDEAPIPTFNQSHPFILIDYSRQVDSVLDRVNKLLLQQVNSFSKIILTLPAVTEPNQSYLALFPDTAQTRQVLWALVLSKLPVLNYLRAISSMAETNVNLGDINRFVNFIQISNVFPVVEQMLGDYRYYEKIKTYLNNLINSQK